MKFKVFVTRKIPMPGLEILERNSCALTVFPHARKPSPEELMRGVRGKDGLLCLLTDKINPVVMDAGLPTLKIVANYAAGFDNIDLPGATSRGIAVTNTPSALTDATAELAWALILACARRIPESDAFTKKGLFKGWDPMLFRGARISGATLGIIGAGRIGGAVALKSAGFGMKVVYSSRHPNAEIEKKVGAQKISLKKLLTVSDFVSIHAPLTPETRHMITSRELSMMKPTAYLINTGRGPIVKEDDLVKALKKGVIAGAGLDVYEFEPGIHPWLLNAPNAVLMPHTGSATFEARDRMSVLAAENIIAALKGRRPPNMVNTGLREAR